LSLALLSTVRTACRDPGDHGLRRKALMRDICAAILISRRESARSPEFSTNVLGRRIGLRNHVLASCPVASVVTSSAVWSGRAAQPADAANAEVFVETLAENVKLGAVVCTDGV